MSGVQRGNAVHFGIGQGKIENSQIFLHTLRVARFYQRHDISLHQPPQHDLRHAFAVVGSNGAQRFVFKR